MLGLLDHARALAEPTRSNDSDQRFFFDSNQKVFFAALVWVKEIPEL
jgi:hypothetical protein